MISVVATTYNGEKYISEQFESIIKQTRKADEIIIIDDDSNDNTVKELKRLQWGNNNVKIYENKVNYGWKRNFYEAIKKATGDIIVLCDQDDIWHLDKLEVIDEIFRKHERVDLLVSEYDELINGELKEWKGKERTLKEVFIDEKLIHTYYPGCTYAFRKSLFDKVEPYWNETLPHDAQIGIAAKVFNSMYIYTAPLIVYRRHANNATKRTPPTITKKQSYVNAEYLYVKYIEDIISNNSGNVENVKKVKYILENTKNYLNNRTSLLEKGSFYSIRCAIAYMKYYYSPKTCVGDIIFGINARRGRNR